MQRPTGDNEGNCGPQRPERPDDAQTSPEAQGARGIAGAERRVVHEEEIFPPFPAARYFGTGSYEMGGSHAQGSDAIGDLNPLGGYGTLSDAGGPGSTTLYGDETPSGESHSSPIVTHPLIVFDVNETLLDLEAMQPIFDRIFQDKGAMRLWFANLIMYSAALTLAECYVPFTDIGSAVMKMLAETRGIRIREADKHELALRFSTMPPHPEVPDALRKLRRSGFRLFTLTDNLLEVQTRQLEHGGLLDLFERRFSADSARHHKPSPHAYAYAQSQLGVAPSELMLVACHTWDTLGAVAAGWGAALIRREGNELLGVGPQPHIVGKDLNEIADQLIARSRMNCASPEE